MKVVDWRSVFGTDSVLPFSAEFRLDLFEFWPDPGLLVDKRRISGDCVGQIVVSHEHSGRPRIVGLSVNHFIPIYTMFRKHVQATPEQVSSQGQAAVYCTLREIEDAFLQYPEELHGVFNVKGNHPDKFIKTPKEISEYVAYVRRRLGEPFSAAIHAPSPFFIDAVRVVFHPRPSFFGATA